MDPRSVDTETTIVKSLTEMVEGLRSPHAEPTSQLLVPIQVGGCVALAGSSLLSKS